MAPPTPIYAPYVGPLPDLTILSSDADRIAALESYIQTLVDALRVAERGYNDALAANQKQIDDAESARDVAQRQWNNGQVLLRNATAERDRLETASADLNRRVKTLTDENDSLKVRVQAAQDVADSALASARSAVQRDLREARDDFNRILSERDELTVKLSDAELHIVALNNRIRSLDDRLNSTDIDAVTESLDVAKQQTVDAERERDAATADVNALTNQLIELRRSFDDATSEISALKSDLIAKKAELHDALIELHEVKTKLSKAAPADPEVHVRLKSAMEQIDDLTAREKALRVQVDDAQIHQAKIIELTGAVTRLQSRANDAEVELDRSLTACTETARQRDELRSSASRLQSQLEAVTVARDSLESELVQKNNDVSRLRERVEQLSVAAVASPSPPRGALDWNARFEGMKDELLQTVAKAVRDRDATPAAGATPSATPATPPPAPGAFHPLFQSGVDFAGLWNAVPDSELYTLWNSVESRDPSAALSPELRWITDQLLPAQLEYICDPSFQVIRPMLRQPRLVDWLVRAAVAFKHVSRKAGGAAKAPHATLADLAPGAAAAGDVDQDDPPISEAGVKEASVDPTVTYWVDLFNNPSTAAVAAPFAASPLFEQAQAVLAYPQDVTGRHRDMRAVSTLDIIRHWALATFVANKRGPHREAGSRQDKFSGEKLKFPKALGSSDPEVVAAAWNEMRRTLNVNLRRAMTVGCDWQEILQLWSLAATTHKNELQQQYIEAAMLDEALTKCPPLHADVIIDAFDRVYFEGSKLFGSSAQMNDWKNCTSRRQTETLVGCANRHITAFIKKIGNPDITADTVWGHKVFRVELNQQFERSIFNDLGNAARGATNQGEFSQELAVRQARFERGGAGADAAELSCLRVVTEHTQPKENARARSVSEFTPVSPAAAAANASYSAAAASPAPATPPPPAPPSPSLTAANAAAIGSPPSPSSAAPASANAVIDGADGGRGRGAGKGKGKGEKGGGRGGGRGGDGASHANEPPPNANGSGHVPYVPKSERARASPATVVSAPEGNLGHPWRHLDSNRTWSNAPEDWANTMVDFINLGEAARDHSLVKAVAQCWPVDSTMSAVGPIPDPADRSKWTADSCRYCRFRAPAPAGTASESMWWYGTGDGQHAQNRCPRLRRFLAQGGNTDMFPGAAAALQECIRFPNAYSREHRPAQK